MGLSKYDQSESYTAVRQIKHFLTKNVALLIHVPDVTIAL